MFRDGEFLHFQARREAGGGQFGEARAGEFTEGLWEAEVAEFFLTRAEGAGYLEFNLGPDGAWWSCGFADVRVRDEVRLAGVESSWRRVGSGWQAEAKVPIQSLGPWLEHGSRINVCFVIEADPLRYASATKLPGIRPDFHQPGHFQTAKWVEV